MNITAYMAENYMCTEDETLECLELFPPTVCKHFLELRAALGLTHKKLLSGMKAIKAEMLGSC